MTEINRLSEEERSRIIADAEQRCQDIAQEITQIKSEIDQELDSDKPDVSYIEVLGRKLDRLKELEKIEHPNIKLAAMEILKLGDPIQCMIDTCERRVLGADQGLRKVICCVSIQNVLQSMGLHPKLSGGSGDGKTLMIVIFADLLPVDAVVFGSASNMSVFYHNDGNRILRISDDYRAGNEAFDTIIKQTSSVFHRPYKHKTVKNQAPIVLEIGSEQTWAITSVDTSQDIQVLNRQLPINVDGSAETTALVNAATIERYGKGEVQFTVDDQVLVCRSIWQTLRDEGYINVRVPFHDRIRWHDNSNRRNPSIFMDLVIAHTAMYRYQRERDADGFYLANEVDFRAARELFTDSKDAQELVSRLTGKEREVCELLAANSGMTKEEIGRNLDPPVTSQRVGQILHGETGKGGLMQKVPIEVEEVSDSVKIDSDHSRTQRIKRYKLSSYNVIGIDSIVTLAPKG
jgi:hypothetical protein